MKKEALLLSALFLTAAFSACKNGDRSADFSDPEPLTVSDSIPIGQILQPLIWKVAGDKAVLLSHKTDSVFFVYRLPDFEYLYCFGAKGEGPDDFSYPYLRTGFISPQGFSAEDLNKKTRHFYDFGETSVRKTGSQQYEVYNALFPVNDSVLFQGQTDLSGNRLKPYYRTVTPKGEPIDSIVPPVYSNAFKVTHFPNGGIGIEGRYYNEAKQVYNNGRLVFLYSDVRRTDVFDITPSGRFVLRSSFGDQSTPEQVNAMNLEDIRQGNALYGIQETPDYIYALSGDFRKEDEGGRKLLRSYIEVYDWDGHPVKKFDLGRAFDRFLADPAHGKIFCYDSDMDFEQVFVYDYAL